MKKFTTFNLQSVVQSKDESLAAIMLIIKQAF